MSSSKKANTLVVISFYDRRATDHLENLLSGLGRVSAGRPFDTLVVVNSTGETQIENAVRERASVVYRENTGMNIGAWDHGWRANQGYKNFVFLQDECSVVTPGWLERIEGVLNYKEIGLIGEAINHAWDKPWEALEAAHKGASLPDHYINGKPADRVPVYLHAFKKWDIDRGTGGRHVRSLVWAMRGDTLKQIDGFPIGANYGECIAAEIAVSKSVESIGLKVAQLAAEDFHCFRHWEWNSNRAGHPPLHKARPVNQLVGLSRKELDCETMNAWKVVVETYRESATIDQEIAITSLQAKLRDREKEILRLRNLLFKT